MNGLTLTLPMTMMLGAIVILTVCAAISVKYRDVGLIGAIVATLLGFFAVTSVNPELIYYTAFVLAISLINLASLKTIKSVIQGVDYSLVGLMALVTLFIFTTQDLAMILAAFVLVSVPTYILVMVRERGANVEVGIKYITFMVLATILFLIGAILLAYTKNAYNELLYILGYVMLVLGLSIEVGVAPLHEWVPDVFSSADPIPLSIIASLAKIVPFVIALKILLSTASPLTVTLSLFTAVLAAISMFTGNIGALTSKEPARVLAYSTVANMGYVLACVVVIAKPEFFYFALTGALLMLFANAAGKIGFFNAIKNRGAFSPLLYLLAFSFIGLPPLMGFWGKLFILFSLIKADYVWLVALMVINSAISVPYYLRLARELGVEWKASLTDYICIATVILIVVTFLPDWFFKGMEVIAQTVSIAI